MVDREASSPDCAEEETRQSIFSQVASVAKFSLLAGEVRHPSYASDDSIYSFDSNANRLESKGEVSTSLLREKELATVAVFSGVVEYGSNWCLIRCV